MIFALMMASALIVLQDRLHSANHMTRQDSKMHEKQNGTDQREHESNRSGIDRRQFSYSYHIPERRSGKERRRGFDRRDGFSRRSGIERRSPYRDGVSRRRGNERRGH